MCVQGVCVVWMSNFAKLSSSWLVQSIREVSRRVSESLVNILIVSPHKKNFLKMLLMYFLDKKRVKRKHFKGVKEARKEGALGLQIPASETRANLGSIAKRILKLGKNRKKQWSAQKWPPPVVTG